MKIGYLFFPLVFFISCGNSESTVETSDQILEKNDSIIEYEMNEKRLSAVDFIDELSLMQEQVLGSVEILFQSDSASVDLNLENTRFEIDLKIQRLETMSVPENGNDLLKATRDVMLFYKTEFNGRFLDMVPLIKSKSRTEKQAEELENYDLKFVEREKEYFEIVFKEQEIFAKANNIKIE